MSSAQRNALKAGLLAGLWSFAGTFGLAVIGFLGQVGQWASAHGREPFPGVSVLGYAAISGVVALGSAVVATIIRTAQAQGILPGQPPSYPKTIDAAGGKDGP